MEQSLQGADVKAAALKGTEKDGQGGENALTLDKREQANDGLRVSHAVLPPLPGERPPLCTPSMLSFHCHPTPRRGWRRVSVKVSRTHTPNTQSDGGMCPHRNQTHQSGRLILSHFESNHVAMSELQDSCTPGLLYYGKTRGAQHYWFDIGISR